MSHLLITHAASAHGLSITHFVLNLRPFVLLMARGRAGALRPSDSTGHDLLTSQSIGQVLDGAFFLQRLRRLHQLGRVRGFRFAFCLPRLLRGGL